MGNWHASPSRMNLLILPVSLIRSLLIFSSPCSSQQVSLLPPLTAMRLTAGLRLPVSAKTCCKVMEQHEKTPHKDLEIFVRRERIVKPGRNLPPPETKFNNLKTNLLHTTTGFLTSRKGHALIFVSSPCCFCRRML